MMRRIKNLIFKYRIYLLGVFCLGLIWDIFFNLRISDSAVLILSFLWILAIFNFKIESRMNFILAAISYGISFIFQFFNKEMIMEKGASWFFVFLLIGLVQTLIRGFSRDEKKS